MHESLKFILGIKLHMFGHFFCPHVYTHVHRVENLPICEISVWYKPLYSVQWKTPDDGQKRCPNQVQTYSKNEIWRN